MSKKSIVTLLVVALVLLVGSFTMYTVDETESALVFQFGEWKHTETESGLHFKLPWRNIETKYDNRILDYDAAPTDIVTKDKKTIVVDNFAKWRIVDPLLFYRSVKTYAGASARLDEIVYSELRVDVGANDLSDVVSGKRAEIMRVVTERSDKAAREYGFEVVDVRIKRADLPEANERAVYNRMVAERQRDAKRYRSEGEEEAAKIRSIADKEKAIILADAYREAQTIMGEGDAIALKTYAAAYNLDPDFYQFTRTLEAYRAAMREKTTLVLSPDSDFFKYLKSIR